MDEHRASNLPAATPESILAAIRAEAPLLDDDDHHLNRLIEQFPPEPIRRALRTRLDFLDEADGEIVLRLLEAYLDPALTAALAQALDRQPDLAPERAWPALALLEAAGALDRYPELVERWDELNDAIDPEDASESLAAQLEEEPEGSWVALEGLGAIEPATRCDIIASLADAPSGPGLVAFLRLLTFAHDDSTRQAALATLFDRRRDDPDHRRAWAFLVLSHFDPKIRDHARQRLAEAGLDAPAIEALLAAVRAAPDLPRPELVGSLVTSVDGEGRGSIVLASRDRDQWVVASFVCDVWRGIVGVNGQVGGDASVIADFFEEFTARQRGEVIEDDPNVAASLLSASWLLSGSTTNAALRFWIERTVGPWFEPRPRVYSFDGDEVATESLAMLAEPSWSILEACPSWVDRSPQTFDQAEAIVLRSGDAPPDPRRDAGAFRYLFEHRLIHRLEHYRRLLHWMAAFWDATAEADLGRSALALAWQLADPQNAVPGHPFIIALATKSLAAAQNDLRHGRDPRRGGGVADD